MFEYQNKNIATLEYLPGYLYLLFVKLFPGYSATQLNVKLTPQFYDLLYMLNVDGDNKFLKSPEKLDTI